MQDRLASQLFQELRSRFSGDYEEVCRFGLPHPVLPSAGAATVIGILWETRDEACARFFRTFYTQPNDGLPRYEAFDEVRHRPGAGTAFTGTGAPST